MVNPVGAFVKPTSLSIPIRSVRSRSPSVSELSRSISTERPRTPRPVSSSRGSTVGSFEFVRPIAQELSSFSTSQDNGLLDLSGRNARVGSANVSTSGYGSVFKSSSNVGVSREWLSTVIGDASSMEVSKTGRDSNGHTSVFATGFGSLIRNVSPFKPSVGERELSTSAAQGSAFLEVEERRQVSNVLNFDQIQKMEKYAKFTPTSVSLSHFLDHNFDGKGLEKSYLFLRREIPVRLANIMMELELLPAELLAQPACQEIVRQYSTSFIEVLEFENVPNSPSTHDMFNQLLTNIRHRHQDTVPRMAEALHNLRDAGNLNVNSKDRLNIAIQYFLDRLYMSRISIQMLIAHHKSLYCPEESKAVDLGNTGTIDPRCDAVKVAKMAYENAAFLCEQIYMDAPKLDLEWVDLTDNEKSSVEFVYIPSHLYHMFFEVFKNSMRATMEFHEDTDTLPDVKVQVVKSPQDISVKISDQGGGISRSVSENCFLYLYTSASRVKLTGGDMGGTTSTNTPMHGLGYGLPLSRLYARYFGGDMKMASCDGYGTDTYIYLRALESDAREMLPIFNANSSFKLKDTSNQVEDWTKDE